MELLSPCSSSSWDNLGYRAVISVVAVCLDINSSVSDSQPHYSVGLSYHMGRLSVQSFLLLYVEKCHIFLLRLIALYGMGGCSHGGGFRFQHFHHFVGGGGGSVLFEVAGNDKHGVPPAYLGHAVRAAGSSGGVPVWGICHRLSFLFISVFSRSIFSCAVAFLKFSPVKQTGEHISSRRS